MYKHTIPSSAARPLLVRALLAAAVWAAASASPAWAQADAKLVPAQSDIQFTSRQMGVPVDGKFRKFDAQVAFDPKKPETARIGLTIDLASISLGAPESEAEVVKPLWFNTAKFPQASFQSTTVKPTGAGKFDVAGKLTIKGQARDVVVPVALAQAGGTTTATGAFTIKRGDFKIGEGEWADTSMVANDVQVKFKLQLTGIGAL
ncbi:YceI family protein [Aquincola sp. MAHUQ-54]|uniref:YceI family protein n=1 Tax=Aquincola agrisoli TaxID=3119538 RepID=A0AAW9QJT7_9BURK